MHVSGALSPSTSLPSLPSSSTLRSAIASCLSFPPSAVCLTWGNLVRSACAPPSCTVCNRPPERKPLLLRKSFILPSLRGQSLALQVSSSWRLVSYILSSFLVVHKEGWQVLHYNTIVLVGSTNITVIFFEHLPTFGHKKIFHSHFVLSLPSSWNQTSPQ